MDSTANWSDIPADQVGGEVFVDAAAKEDAAKVSSGLSDVVGDIDIGGEIDIRDLENELLDTSSVMSTDSPIVAVVPVTSGTLPTDLPSDKLVIDERARVPVVNVQMTSNDLKLIKTTTEPTTTSTMVTPTTVPQVILSHNKVTVMENLKSNKPSLAPPLVIGPVSDYVASALVVEKWKYVPNEGSIIRLPFHGLEQHVRQRLSPLERKRLQMSAHRNDFRWIFYHKSIIKFNFSIVHKCNF